MVTMARPDHEIADDPTVPYAERLNAACRALKAGTRRPPSVSPPIFCAAKDAGPAPMTIAETPRLVLVRCAA